MPEPPFFGQIQPRSNRIGHPRPILVRRSATRFPAPTHPIVARRSATGPLRCAPHCRPSLRDGAPAFLPALWGRCRRKRRRRACARRGPRPRQCRSGFRWREKMAEKYSEQLRRIAMAIFGGACQKLLRPPKDAALCAYSMIFIELTEQPIRARRSPHPSKNGNKWQSWEGCKAFVHYCKSPALCTRRSGFVRRLMKSRSTQAESCSALARIR